MVTAATASADSAGGTPTTRGSLDRGSHQEPEGAAERLRATFAAGATRPLAWRKAQLRAIIDMLTEREAELTEALAADLGKPAVEGWLTDIAQVVNEVRHILGHLEGWAAPDKVKVPAQLQPGRAKVVKEPVGAALVIAPWNYPVQLLLLPMAFAIAAGNTVCGKPSELTPETSAALARWSSLYLDRQAVTVIEGDAQVAQTLLAQRWDHIFYTGNGRIGRVVMEAAARHLTPVTLELGGKSPAIVDRTANVEVAARRIAWGKFLNAGQTCVAPDYVLVDRQVEEPLVAALVDSIGQFYGADPQRSPDFGRIVNDRHVQRLKGLLDSLETSQVVTGGQVVTEARYVAPTVLTGTTWDEPVMGEEIFGPILPVMAVDSVEAAVTEVNRRDKPLALYVFSEDQGAVRAVTEGTSSGGLCVNATLLHLAVSDLPFGGVGPSGMGAYHGRWGFDTFSHHKSVLVRPTRFDPPVTYPPYGRIKSWLLRKAF
jgi:aldehyde dehydrogenase (NAD+)